MIGRKPPVRSIIMYPARSRSRFTPIQHRVPKIIPSRHHRSQLSKPDSSIGYARGLTIIGFILVIIIFRFVPPSSIADIPLPNAYLPFLLPLYLAVFGLVYSLSKNTKLAIIITWIIETGVFLRLQHISI